VITEKEILRKLILLFFPLRACRKEYMFILRSFNWLVLHKEEKAELKGLSTSRKRSQKTGSGKRPEGKRGKINAWIRDLTNALKPCLLTTISKEWLNREPKLELKKYLA